MVAAGHGAGRGSLRDQLLKAGTSLLQGGVARASQFAQDYADSAQLESAHRVMSQPDADNPFGSSQISASDAHAVHHAIIAKAKAGELTVEGRGAEEGWPVGFPADGPQAIQWDPLTLVEQLGYKERPTSITYAMREAMHWKLPLLAALRMLMVSDISEFCRPQRPPHEPGYRIRLRSGRDTPTPVEAREAERLERLILTTGRYDESPAERDGFTAFTKKVWWDSMTHDAMTFEKIPDRKGRPCQWDAVDATTIRLADSARLVPNRDMDSIRTVQIYDNTVIAKFSRREVAYRVRNPRTAIYNHGYGCAEVELALPLVTYLLWGQQYNGRQFSQGIWTKGLLGIMGNLPDHKLRAFRRQFYQMVSGVENVGRVPIVTGAEDLRWIKLQGDNREMEFGEWLDWNTKGICSVYLTNPMEINFKYGAGGQRGAMFDSAQKSSVVTSRNRRLGPKLSFYEEALNEEIVWEINPDFSIEFTGLSSMTPKELADLETQKVRTYMLVDEVRAQHDLEPLADGLGQVINDPNWMQGRRDLMLQQQMEAAGGAEGAEVAAATGAPVSGESKAPQTSSRDSDGASSSNEAAAEGPATATKSLASSPVVIDVEL